MQVVNLESDKVVEISHSEIPLKSYKSTFFIQTKDKPMIALLSSLSLHRKGQV